MILRVFLIQEKYGDDIEERFDMIEHQRQDVLKEIKHIVSKCDRCGTCLPVCPLFGIKGIELSSARGKNNIASSY